MPDHQWDGTRLRFGEPDGRWGKYVDLQGTPGRAGASGGGGGISSTQALQLSTLLNIFGGWIASTPTVDITSLTAEELTVSGVATATGYYAGIPGGAPVAAQYEWDWGDGSLTLDDLTAQHTYAEAGTYTVAFRAANHIGWSAPVTQEIEVTDAAGDPYWTSVVLLLNGADLTDSTGRHTVETFSGTVTSSGGMLSFDGASALRINDGLTDFNFPASFTIEGQINVIVAAAGTEVFLSHYGAVSGDWEMFTRGSPNYNGGFYASSGDYQEPTTPAWVTDSLHDFAFVYDSATTAHSLYLDGARISTSTGQPANYTTASPLALFVGRESSFSTSFFKGLLRARITKGVARYSGASYTPPTWPIASG